VETKASLVKDPPSSDSDHRHREKSTLTMSGDASAAKALDATDPMAPMKESLQAAVGERATPSASPSRSRAASATRSPLMDQFRAYAKFGDSKADGKVISLSQSDKWMKQAKVIDGKKITSTDTGIYFKKLKILKLTLTDYHKFLEELSKAKKVEVSEIREKMINCGPPGLTGTTTAVKTAAVDRLTDSTRYTGSHRMRFDEGGRGRGIQGRKDAPDGAGYVQGYANKDSYDKSH